MPDALALALGVASAFGVLATAAGVLWWLVKPRVQRWAQEQIIGPLHETRHQVTVNHHSSERPTLLDRFDDLQDEVRQLRGDFTNHLLLANKDTAAMWRAIEAVAKSDPPSDA